MMICPAERGQYFYRGRAIWLDRLTCGLPHLRPGLPTKKELRPNPRLYLRVVRKDVLKKIRSA